MWARVMRKRELADMRCAWLCMSILMFFFSVQLSACSVFRASIPVPDLDSRIQKGLIRSGGLERTFLYYIPDNLPNGAPLFILLHGSKGSGKIMREMTGYRFDILADREKYVAVYPDGYEGHWNDCRKGASDSAHKIDVDDIAYMKSLISYISDEAGINRDLVFIAGFSNGGHMGFRLAVEAPGTVKAIAAVAAHVPASVNNACGDPEQFVPVLLCSGTEDPINPFGGGEVSILGIINKGRVLSADDSVVFWLAPASFPVRMESQVLPEDEKKEAASAVEIRRWTSAGQPVVVQYVIHGGGHTLPGAPEYYPAFIMGQTNHRIRIADAIVGFFLAHPVGIADE